MILGLPASAAFHVAPGVLGLLNGADRAARLPPFSVERSLVLMLPAAAKRI